MQLAFRRMTVPELRTLYQCFLTLPSVLLGKVFKPSAKASSLVSPSSRHLCDFAPAVPSVPHDFQSLLLCWSPRCIGPALFWRGHRWLVGFVDVLSNLAFSTEASRGHGRGHCWRGRDRMRSRSLALVAWRRRADLRRWLRLGRQQLLWLLWLLLLLWRGTMRRLERLLLELGWQRSVGVRIVVRLGGRGLYHGWTSGCGLRTDRTSSI